MKIITAVISFFFFVTISVLAQVTVFSGQKVDWGWSGATTNAHVVSFLEQNWKEGEELSLQEKANKAGLNCEFLWKVPQGQVHQAVISGSSFMTGQKIDNVEISLWPDGRGQITLYSKGEISGKVQAWTSSRREGGGRQLTAGDYKVTGLQVKGWSKAFRAPMPYKVSLDGEAATRGIFIHQGDLSGEKPGVNEYHGCIRVSRLTGQRFMDLLPAGTTVKVVWK